MIFLKMLSRRRARAFQLCQSQAVQIKIDDMVAQALENDSSDEGIQKLKGRKDTACVENTFIDILVVDVKKGNTLVFHFTVGMPFKKIKVSAEYTPPPIEP